MTTQEQLKVEVKACAESIEEAARNDYDGIAEYFEDTLDVEIIVGWQGDYRGARIALALGGPTVYFNTRTGDVQGYWGSSYAEYHVRSWATEAVDNFFEEAWDAQHNF